MAQGVVGYESKSDTRSRRIPRRARRRGLFAIIVSAIILLVAWRFPALNRDWGTVARIEVDVRDWSTGQPIPGATVDLLGFNGAPVPKHISSATPTDAAGRATARVVVAAGSTNYLIAERVNFSTNSESVQVNAQGYSTSTVPLPRRGSTWRVPNGRINAVLRVRVDLSRPNTAATQPKTGGTAAQQFNACK